MQEKALLLVGDGVLDADVRAEKLLQFFGVTYEKQHVSEFQFFKTSSTENSGSNRVICAARTFGRILRQGRNLSRRADEVACQTHSVFLYSEGDAVVLAKLIGELTGTHISVSRGAEGDTEWYIADDPGGACGAMRGLQVCPAAATVGTCDFFDKKVNSMTARIGSSDRAAFLRVGFGDVPVFISSVPLLDIDSELTTRNFDIRDHLFSAVPVVSYIRWAFPKTSWSAPEANACLIIDDPLLQARYGFVRFEELLTLMKQLRFSTSIAFIPWNWRRSDSGVVQLFKDNPDCYSICVHGCDHTGAEFVGLDRQQLRWRVSEARRRMSVHERRTGLEHDRMMVFPQGLFSEPAIAELKHAGFHAVVNTEVHSSPYGEKRLRICDVWDVAVMAYSEFPIYSRRYPTQGIENFAFDLLLGKPCLVVIHHDFCSDGYMRLSQLVEQLNSLKVPIVWRCLGDVVRRSYRQKEVSQDLIEIEMYGTELVLENRADRPKSYLMRRRESHAQDIESLRAGSHELPWKSAGGYIKSQLKVEAGETILLTLRFKTEAHVTDAPNFVHSARTMLRRYLSEMRDNYFVPAKARMTGFSRS